MNSFNTQWLLSLPASSAARLNAGSKHRYENLFITSDPPGSQLGSGGGTAYLLFKAWQNSTKKKTSFESWIQTSRKLIIHGSGESRRLPAYAAEGKPLLPVPALRHDCGQYPDQTLLDLQIQAYDRLCSYASDNYRVMVSCGDVLMRFDHWLPQYPEADVLIFGLTAPPEEAEQHGVLVCTPDTAGNLMFFLQKPPSNQIRTLAKTYRYYLDTGVWLLSQRALSVLMKKCGWSKTENDFKNGVPKHYELYAKFGPALGLEPKENDPDIKQLTCAVVPLPSAHFYHFGTNRSVLASVSQLENPYINQRAFGHESMENRVSTIIQNSEVKCDLTEKHRYIWIENSSIPADWKLAERHVLTGVPPNNWNISLPPCTCLDFMPVMPAKKTKNSDNLLCIRFYGFDDSFRGACEAHGTAFLSRPLSEWIAARGLEWNIPGLSRNTDIQNATIFPVLKQSDITSDFLNWLFAIKPENNPKLRQVWLNAPRLSAKQLLQQADIERVAQQRLEHMAKDFSGMPQSRWIEKCTRLDLAKTAAMYTARNWSLPQTCNVKDISTVHDSMFRAAMAEPKKQEVKSHETEAFRRLRNLIVDQMALAPVSPAQNVIDDQIVWCRAPIRLDLAGGWSDTPPYCIEHGGRVVNVALNLNGQPPIQVFGRICKEPHILVRSIDLGLEDKIEKYDDLRQIGQLGSGFGIARAALALSGFDPRFHAKGGKTSLEKQLKSDFGGGLELSMLAAVPKGSGLGTSSILAATLFAAIGELSGLHWDTPDLFNRTLALEQILTAGGGWQDQVGGITGGLKLTETDPGITQKIIIRWLPDLFFSEEYSGTEILLYYTGITRVAHDILGEIVRGIFLNSSDHLNIIKEISLNALYCTDAIQRNDWNQLCEAIRRSWLLNQRLDKGTNPPQVQAILEKIKDYTAAAKLLGAGGGGYMLILAKDRNAGMQIKHILQANPPNKLARFVNTSLSAEGLNITRS